MTDAAELPLHLGEKTMAALNDRHILENYGDVPLALLRNFA